MDFSDSFMYALAILSEPWGEGLTIDEKIKYCEEAEEYYREKMEAEELMANDDIMENPVIEDSAIRKSEAVRDYAYDKCCDWKEKALILKTLKSSVDESIKKMTDTHGADQAQEHSNFSKEPLATKR